MRGILTKDDSFIPSAIVEKYCFNPDFDFELELKGFACTDK